MKQAHRNGLLDGLLRPPFVGDMAYLATALFKRPKPDEMSALIKSEVERANEDVERAFRSVE